MTQGLSLMQNRALGLIKMLDPTPTMQELADHLGLASKSGAARLIDQLEEKGFVERLPGAARGIRALAEPGAWNTSLAARSSSALIKELNRRGFRVVDMRRARRGLDTEGLGREAPATSAQRLGSPP